MEIDPSKVTRVVVVDDKGRVYDKANINVMLDLQDGWQTLKIFVGKFDASGMLKL